MTGLRALDPGGWGPYLAPGERLLWEGAPATGLRLRPGDGGGIVVGLIFVGFGSVWTVQAAAAGGPAVLPWLAALPVLTGLWLGLGRLFWDRHRRRHTRYALTDRRALIATAHRGRRMRALTIAPGMQLEHRPGPEGTIVLARETLLGQRITGRAQRRGNLEEVGFAFIPDGERVMALIHAVLRERARERP